MLLKHVKEFNGFTEYFTVIFIKPQTFYFTHCQIYRNWSKEFITRRSVSYKSYKIKFSCMWWVTIPNVAVLHSLSANKGTRKYRSRKADWKYITQQVSFLHFIALLLFWEKCIAKSHCSLHWLNVGALSHPVVFDVHVKLKISIHFLSMRFEGPT